MRRIHYAGDRSLTSVPVQAEAQAYFARMTTAPSKPFRDAVNQAVYEWKKQGAWALLKGLWLLCAGTQQAALLSVIGDAPRDAVNSLATFVALKGFDLNSGGSVTFPITSTILADDNFVCVVGGLSSVPSDGVTHDLITCSGASNPHGPGTLASNWNGSFQALGVGQAAFSSGLAGTPSAFVVGGRGGTKGISPAGITAFGGVGYTRGSNYVAAGPFRIAAYAFLGSAASDAQGMQLAQTLAWLLNSLGALL